MLLSLFLCVVPLLTNEFCVSLCFFFPVYLCFCLLSLYRTRAPMSLKVFPRPHTQPNWRRTQKPRPRSKQNSRLARNPRHLPSGTCLQSYVFYYVVHDMIHRIQPCWNEYLLGLTFDWFWFFCSPFPSFNLVLTYHILTGCLKRRQRATKAKAYFLRVTAWLKPRILDGTPTNPLCKFSHKDLLTYSSKRRCTPFGITQYILV